MGYDERKFRELVLYAAERLREDPSGGATKLNKVLFFAEFAHMREQGRPITGADYQKLEWGPAPRRLLPIRQQLVADGDAVIEDDVFNNYPQQRLTPTRAADTSLFTKDELEAVDRVVKELWGQTGSQVSAVSHEEMGWRMVEEGETIPFLAAYLRPPRMTPAIAARAAELAKLRTGQ